MAFGGDTELDASLRLGFAGGYARADISDAGARSGSSTTLDSYFASIYGTYTSRSGWYADSTVTYARHMYETSRLVTFILPNETAKGSFKADQLGGKLTAGYPLVFGAMTTTPVVSLDYNYLRQDGYTERGAPGANLVVDGQNTYSVRTGLGVNFAAVLFDGEFRPSAHVAWYHEFNPNTMDMTSRYAAAGGQGFTTPGIKIGAETVNVGAGVDLMDDDGITLSVKYDLDVRDGYVGNTGGLQFRVGF
jgi:outer membrane autotransporter protein